MFELGGQELIIFIDSGDTLIDEASQVYDARGIVTEAALIEGAEQLLKQLHEDGFTVVMVADGEVESFQNVYRNNGLRYCFDEWVISEEVGKQKPDAIMFETACKALKLTEADKKRIVMIGNNLKKDIAGANRQGLISIWMDWSPRYFHSVEEPDWQPDYTVKKPLELLPLLYHLNEEMKGKRYQQAEAGRRRE